MIFDMDGVIFDTERLYLEVWQEIFKEYGYVLEKEDYLSCMGRGREKVKEIYISKFGVKLPIDEMYRLKDERLDYRIENEANLLKEGVIETLEYLKDNNYKVGLATSARRNRVKRDLSKFNIKKYFDYIITGEEVKKGKPNPEIFLKAMEMLSENKENTLIIEDSKSGIEAAIKSGAKVLHIRDLIKLDNKEIKYVENLGEVIQYLSLSVKTIL